MSDGAPYSLSFYDLLQFPLFKVAAKQDDKGLMKTIFYEAGIDTSKEFELVEVLHRPASSKEPWFGLRVQGEERLDKVWLESGVASLEAKLFTKDKSLRDTLASLDPRNAANKKKDFTDDSECSVEVYDEDCI
jgi:hypothetical protein